MPPPGKAHQELSSSGFGIQIVIAVVFSHPLSQWVCSAPVPGSKPRGSAGEGRHSTQSKASWNPDFVHHPQTSFS